MSKTVHYLHHYVVCSSNTEGWKTWHHTVAIERDILLLVVVVVVIVVVVVAVVVLVVLVVVVVAVVLLPTTTTTVIIIIKDHNSIPTVSVHYRVYFS